MMRIARIIPFLLATAVLLPDAARICWADESEQAGPELNAPTESAWPPKREPIEESTWPPPKEQEPAELPSSVASPLKIAEVETERSTQLEFIAREADRQTRHGFELAGRGAYFAARAEFVGSLRLMAEGLDTEHKSDVHRKALRAALTALRESEDFLPDGPRPEAELDLARIIAAHTTPVLKEVPKNLTSMTAMKCYFTFAQEQFASAVGTEVAGSMALRGLGKLHDEMANKNGLTIKAAAPKAVVFYQASLLVFSENYLAANDLGVLLARSGKYSSAKSMFEYSLSLFRQSTTWRNLAVVHRRLGQEEAAQRAEREAMLIEQIENARRNKASIAGNAPVRWVDPQTMAQTSSGAPVSPGAAQTPTQAAGQPVEPSRLAPAGGDVRTAGRPTPSPSSGRRSPWGRPTKIK